MRAGTKLLGALLLAALVCAAPAASAATLYRAADDSSGALAQGAVEAYRALDYVSARSGFLAALEAEPRPEGRERARLLYNLGNVAARRERWPEAVGWFEAARRLRPRDPDTFANLELARGKAGFAPADRGDLAATFERLLGLWTPAESRWWALLGIFVAAGGLAFEALRGGALGRRLALAGALVLALTCAPWLRHHFKALADPVLVIAAGPLSATSEPRASAARIFEVSPDTQLERIGTFLDWTQVQHPRAGIGWLPNEALFPLER